MFPIVNYMTVNDYRHVTYMCNVVEKLKTKTKSNATSQKLEGSLSRWTAMRCENLGAIMSCQRFLGFHLKGFHLAASINFWTYIV